MDRDYVETRIMKIEITTTQAVDVEQLARDIRASIGYENISMHAIMTNLHDVPVWMSGLEVIVHINRAVRETTGQTFHSELRPLQACDGNTSATRG